MTPEQMRRAAELLQLAWAGYERSTNEHADLARLLREQAEATGWRPIETAPRDGIVLLAVDADGERKTFVAEMTIDKYGELRWLITVGWCGWTRLHSAWTPLGWQPLPPPPEGGK